MNNVMNENATVLEQYAYLLVKEAKRIAANASGWHKPTETPKPGIYLCKDKTGRPFLQQLLPGYRWTSNVYRWMVIPE